MCLHGNQFSGHYRQVGCYREVAAKTGLTVSQNLQFFILKTLFNIVEDQFKKKMNFDVCVVWWCSEGLMNSQESKSFEIDAVTIKKSMTEYHHWINGLADHLFYHSSLREKKMSMLNLATCLFSLFWST